MERDILLRQVLDLTEEILGLTEEADLDDDEVYRIHRLAEQLQDELHSVLEDE